jgi:ribonucleotide reductase alpha subunit
MAITTPAKPKPVGSNASQVAAKRYSIKDASGQVTEDWDAIVERVINHVAAAESDYHERECFVRDVGDILRERLFLPNTPALVNAGAGRQLQTMPRMPRPHAPHRRLRYLLHL